MVPCSLHSWLLLLLVCGRTAAMVFAPAGSLRGFPELHPTDQSAPPPPTPKKFQLVIGNKRYSSWSLRAWLALQHVIDADNYEEILCPVAGDRASEEVRAEAKKRVLKHSPSGLVPALVDKELGITVCESLAIILHLADRYPTAMLLPKDPVCVSSSISHAG